MSMTTLGKMQDYYREMDDAEDRYSASQDKKRSVKLAADEVARRANVLYGKVTKVIGKYANKGTSRVPLATHPECVVQRVIEMLAQKGIKAEHAFNEMHPAYDFLNIDMASVKIG